MTKVLHSEGQDCQSEGSEILAGYVCEKLEFIKVSKNPTAKPTNNQINK